MGEKKVDLFRFFPSAKWVKEGERRGEGIGEERGKERGENKEGGGEEGERKEEKEEGRWDLYLPNILEGRGGGNEPVSFLPDRFSSLGGEREREGKGEGEREGERIEPGFYRGVEGQSGFEYLFIMEDGKMVFFQCCLSSLLGRKGEGVGERERRKVVRDLWRKVGLIRKEIRGYRENGGRVGGRNGREIFQQEEEEWSHQQQHYQQPLQERDCFLVLTFPSLPFLSFEQFRREVRNGPRRGEGKRIKEDYEEFREFGGGVVVVEGEGMREGWGKSLEGLGKLVVEVEERWEEKE